MAIVKIGLSENDISCVFMISWAASADEATSVGTLPKWTSMSGPYLCEIAWRERCGLDPSWCKFPMIGSFGGDGGKIILVFEWSEKMCRKPYINNVIKMMNENKETTKVSMDGKIMMLLPTIC